MSKDNTTLGRFQLTGIASAPRGIPQIEVTFDIDANGIVNVTAKDLGSGKEQNITITSSTNMTDEEIDAKVREAESFAEEDKKKKEEIETVNNAQSIIYQTEKSLKDYGDKIDETDKANVEGKIAELRNLLSDNASSEDIKAKSDEVTQDFYKISEKIYENVNPSTEGESSDPVDDDVVDADYEVMDDDEE